MWPGLELGETKFCPAFQFRDGKIIDALANFNQDRASPCGGRPDQRRRSAPRLVADPTRICRLALTVQAGRRLTSWAEISMGQFEDAFREADEK